MFQQIEPAIKLKRVSADNFRANFPRDIGCQVALPGCSWSDDKECAPHPNSIELTHLDLRLNIVGAHAISSFQVFLDSASPLVAESTSKKAREGAGTTTASPFSFAALQNEQHPSKEKMQ